MIFDESYEHIILNTNNISDFKTIIKSYILINLDNKSIIDLIKSFNLIIFKTSITNTKPETINFILHNKKFKKIIRFDFNDFLNLAENNNIIIYSLDNTSMVNYFIYKITLYDFVMS